MRSVAGGLLDVFEGKRARAHHKRRNRHRHECLFYCEVLLRFVSLVAGVIAGGEDDGVLAGPRILIYVQIHRAGHVRLGIKRRTLLLGGFLLRE